MQSVKRILPCLDIKDGKVVVGQQFKNVKAVDDPISLARYYNLSGADELVVYDISASVERRQVFSELLTAIRREVTLPIVVGGGIQSLSDIENALALGADKISINSGAIIDHTLIEKASKRFGSEKIILSIDINTVNGQYIVFSSAGQRSTGLDAIDWAKKGEADGAGELVLNSIATDGEKKGFDIPLLTAFSQTVSLPIVASGGAGKAEDFLALFQQAPTITAGLAASIFHSKEVDITALKKYLKEQNIAVALGDA